MRCALAALALLLAGCVNALWVSAYEDAATQETLVVHEATHWLMRCSSGRQDSAHATPGVWGAQGIEGRAWRR